VTTRFSILRDILALDDVSAQQKLVLIAMNQYGDDDGRNIYPATETIAKLASLSTRQAHRHIKVLRQRGYLSPHGNKSRNNTVRYALNVPTRVTPEVSPPRHPRHTTDPHNKPLTIPEQVRDSNFIFNQGGQAVADNPAIPPISERVGRLIDTERREQAERKARLEGRHPR
jgi:hypothetical protein